ncbi:DUF4328 domain-containing protein [Kitasatospora sp. NPDC057015]|uniref:DUF4328 domain-containing protein n=1 Tax=Kitasatospora sp. NPDC057015 TaxID=3346001 RepID=UPI0036364013
MKSESLGGAPRPRVLPYSGLVADPRPLALAAQILIAAQTAAQLALAMAGGSRSEVFARTGAISGLLLLSTVIVFLCWFRRCRRNAEILAPGTHKYSGGLAVGGWFIPVAMWWIPRRVTMDIWRATGPVAGTWVIDAWWTAWLAKTVGAAIVLRMQSNLDGYSLYNQVVGVVAAALAILVIRRITAGQDAKVRAHLATVPFAPAPGV